MNQTDKRFCPTSLGDWLEACRETGIPAVPATQIASVACEDYLSWDTEGPHQDRLAAVHRRVMQVAQRDHMVRFDCCAGIEVKSAMAAGRTEWQPEFGQLMLDDSRLLDIVTELPYDEIAIWQRPWIKPYIISNYPVEYRVFVRDGKIVGISNYYPQRPIPRLEVQLAVVANYTRQLIRVLRTPFEWPGGMLFHLNRDKLDLGGIHFTADYIVGADNSILFLEGGPPHEFGAASCCFREGEIEGIALEDRN